MSRLLKILILKKNDFEIKENKLIWKTKLIKY